MKGSVVVVAKPAKLAGFERDPSDAKNASPKVYGMAPNAQRCQNLGARTAQHYTEVHSSCW
jgi:hypothetical protein